jgi:hypothetical protein
MALPSRAAIAATIRAMPVSCQRRRADTPPAMPPLAYSFMLH